MTKDKPDKIDHDAPTLDTPAEAPDGGDITVKMTPATPMPETIGPYRILETLGEGGFGVVYLADQTEPVRRRVALKVIKPGMDSNQVIARFEAERQALAVMDHPNVATVFDAGVTPASTGSRPYFVMEHVPGMPITDHCDRHRLSINERLALFMRVCEAVQHAHQKGIIHRDIKPSNILVSVRDGKAMPMVIDFGVAKALHQKLTEKTLFTEQGQLVGTPEYMSPEQAEMSAQDIDTRSDIYSLGVLLYELLTGVLPFDPKSLRQTGFAGIQRIIREQEPPKPSTRLGGLGDASSESASARRVDPRLLQRELRGDLDWIVMKALEKDRTRRYDTATSLADDIRRYLNHEAVLASPPSAAYQLRKFAHRNRTGVLAGGIVAVAMVAATVVSIVFALQAEAARADEAERAEELQQVADFQAGQLGGVDPAAMGLALRDGLREKLAALSTRRGLDDDAAAAALEEYDALVAGADFTGLALDALGQHIFEPALEAINRQFEDQPMVRASLLQTLADTMREAGLLDRASPPQMEALDIRRAELGDDHPDTLISISNMGVLLKLMGKRAEAELFFREALEGRRRTLGNDHPDTLSSLNNMGILLVAQGEPVEAEPYYREALEGRRRTLGVDHADTLTSINNMGSLLLSQNRLADAEPFFRDALEGHRRTLGDDHPSTLISLNNIGALLKKQGKLTEAELYYREALDGHRRVLGDEHQDTLTSINNMGGLLYSQGKLAEAEPYYREAMEGQRHVLGDEHPSTLVAINNMGGLLCDLDRLEEADALGTEAVEQGRAALPPGHWFVGVFLAHHARTLAKMERFSESEERALEAFDILEAALGASHERTTTIARQLADLYDTWNAAEPGAGYDAKTAEWRAKLPK